MLQRILRNLAVVSAGAGAAFMVSAASAQQEPTVDPQTESEPGSVYTGDEEQSPLGGAADAGFGGAADAGYGGAADAGLGGGADAGMGGGGDAGTIIEEDYEKYGPNVE